MTDGFSIAIPLGFLILAGLLAWFLAETKGRWALKAILTACVALYSLETWSALDSYLGWPSREAMPQRSLMISAIVREPNLSKGDAGGIYLWVIPIGREDPDPFAYDPKPAEPRAYRIPYSRAVHEQVAQAMQAMRQNGRPILIERLGEPGLAGGRQGFDDDGGLRMREMPPPSIPEKPPR